MRCLPEATLVSLTSARGHIVSLAEASAPPSPISFGSYEVQKEHTAEIEHEIIGRKNIALIMPKVVRNDLKWGPYQSEICRKRDQKSVLKVVEKSRKMRM